jgi:hypothetical protein
MPLVASEPNSASLLSAPCSHELTLLFFPGPEGWRGWRWMECLSFFFVCVFVLFFGSTGVWSQCFALNKTGTLPFVPCLQSCFCFLTQAWLHSPELPWTQFYLKCHSCASSHWGWFLFLFFSFIYLEKRQINLGNFKKPFFRGKKKTKKPKTLNLGFWLRN